MSLKSLRESSRDMSDFDKAPVESTSEHRPIYNLEIGSLLMQLIQFRDELYNIISRYHWGNQLLKNHTTF